MKERKQTKGREEAAFRLETLFPSVALRRREIGGDRPPPFAFVGRPSASGPGHTEAGPLPLLLSFVLVATLGSLADDFDSILQHLEPFGAAEQRPRQDHHHHDALH